LKGGEPLRIAVERIWGPNALAVGCPQLHTSPADPEHVRRSDSRRPGRTDVSAEVGVLLSPDAAREEEPLRETDLDLSEVALVGPWSAGSEGRPVEGPGRLSRTERIG